jgi:redox-sensitive bicupin YhaK (pirin superfamily)
VGDGFHVASVITPDLALSPFLLFDYGAPSTFSPASRPRGVGPHPHRGFETVTLVYAGEVAHRDSAGNSGLIGPGDVQWMTAASGVVHEEFHSPAFTREGGSFEVAQIWVNLPARFKMSPPRYQTLLRAGFPAVSLPGESGTVRVVGGDYASVKGAAATWSPVNIWDLRLEAGARATLPIPSGFNAAVFVRHGGLTVAGVDAPAQRLVRLDRQAADVEVEAASPTEALVLSGEPIDEPVVAHGPFVMNTRAEIMQAFQDYETGRMGRL